MWAAFFVPKTIKQTKFAMIVFWFFTSGSDAMGYSLMFLWIILPVTTFIVSVVIGKNNFWGKGKWAFTIFFGAMYMLAEYGTFKMANNIAFNKLNAPDFGMIVAGAIISAIGIESFSYLGQLNNYITLLIQPVRKFFRAGRSCFYSLFSL